MVFLCLLLCAAPRVGLAGESRLHLGEAGALVFSLSPPPAARSMGSVSSQEPSAEAPPLPLAAPALPAESLFSRAYLKLLLEDTAYIFSTPIRWQEKQWLTFAAVALGLGAASLLDKTVWEVVRHNQSSFPRNAADIVAEGGVYALAIVALPFYATGKLLDNPKAVSVALDSIASTMIAAWMITPALKFVVGRSLPRDDEGTYSFHPFTYRFQFNGGPQSFPSGHAAQSFAIASTIAAHYEQGWIKAVAFSLAGAVSFSRIYQGNHFLSDSLAGALIGTTVGYAVVHFNQQRRNTKKEPPFALIPCPVPGGFGLMVAFQMGS